MKYLALKNICAGGNFIREGEYVELGGEVAAEYLSVGAIGQAESLELDKTQTDEPQAEETTQDPQPGINTTETQEQQPAESESQAGQAEKTAPDEAAAKKNKGKK